MMIEKRGLNKLLQLLEECIDIKYCQKVDERYMKSLQYNDVDRPPLVVQADFGMTLELPAPWSEFKRYSYSEAFKNPSAMMQNMLLNRVVPGVLLRDDNPLAIRNDHGTIQVASILGSKWRMYEDNYPWVDHFDTIEDIQEILKAKLTEKVDDKGILPNSIKTLKFYNDKLNAYPNCKKAVQISLPDLQGPIDTAEQLWGSDIYYAFNENQDLLKRLLSIIVDTMLKVEKVFRKYSYDRLEPDFNTQHGYVIPGRIMIRNDSSIMISPEMYVEFIYPYDEIVLQKVGNGSIHFCGNGQHLIEKMLGIPYLKGLDFGEPKYMDISYIYALCREKKVAITNLNPSRSDIISGKAIKDFPTGVVFVYHTSSFDDAVEVLQRYKEL